MPQGDWTEPPRLGGAWPRPADILRAGGRWGRPFLVASALAILVAGCAQNTAEAPRVATHGSYNRPASYDPPGPPSDPWGPWIRDASRRFDVPERWIREVMRQESGGRPGATSRVGAMGLMQVMPGTYRELRNRYGFGDDPYHPYDSIMAGAAYIREMYDLYGSPAFLAAYNAGPRRLEDYLWNSRGLPTETRNYVARIGPRIVGSHPNRRARPEVYAAAEIPLDIPPGPRRMDGATMLALREQREAVNPGIQVASLPPGPVVRMDPIPDGSTMPAPVASSASYQVASVGTVVRMDPIPDGSTPEGAARLAEVEARQSFAADPPPPVLAAPAPAPMAPPAARSFAAAPAKAASPGRQAPAAMVAVSPVRGGRTTLAAVTPTPAPSRGFGLVGSAQAASLPAATVRPAAGGSGQWAVQVGAFASAEQARSAAGQASSAGGRVAVQKVAQGRSTLYRARVIGLSQSSAQQLCDRMRGRGACMVLSPDAQRG